ncbi:hypothetical protein [Levilactobacillus enshiensis]|uniref:hypothetical protein n=1 Tax=Levilactobacillus enshiensis TaxID=2590213 RepID=UPI00117B2982|nr:hypothetical protein [Levilactobacillus enshiensis]
MAIFKSNSKQVNIASRGAKAELISDSNAIIYRDKWATGTVLYTERNPTRYFDKTSYQYNNATIPMDLPLTKAKNGIKIYLSQIANMSAPYGWGYIPVRSGSSKFTNANPIVIPIANLVAGYTTQISVDLSDYHNFEWYFQFPTTFKADSNGNLVVSNNSTLSYQISTIMDGNGTQFSSVPQKGLTIGMFQWLDIDNAGHTAQLAGTANAMIDHIEAY